MYFVWKTRGVTLNDDLIKKIYKKYLILHKPININIHSHLEKKWLFLSFLEGKRLGSVSYL